MIRSLQTKNEKVNSVSRKKAVLIIKKMRNLKLEIKISIGAAVALVIGVLVFLLSKKEKIETRFDGKLPLVISSQLNTTFSNYITTVPVSYTALITGRHESGKSRILNYFCEEQTKLGRLALNFDLKSVKTFNDLLSIFRISAIDQFNNLKSTISSSALKKIPDFDASTSLPEANALPDKLKNLYLALYSQLANLLEHGFSQKSIFQFGRILGNSYQALAPIIIIQNYDYIYNITAPNDEEFGVKLADAIESMLSARSHKHHYIPVFFEIKNSLLKTRHRWSNAFRFVEIPNIEAPEREFVNHYKLFSLNEMKKILGIFGPHPGSISSIYEAMRVGIKIDDAISVEQRRIHNIVNKARRNNATLSAFCAAPNDFHPSNEAQIAEFYDLIEQGILYLDNELIMRPSNKAVLAALC